MKLVNFDRSPDSPSITLRGAGHDWDLHNFAVLTAVRSIGTSLQLIWTIDRRLLAQHNSSNPWSDPTNSATSCQLVFSDVESFRDTGRRSDDDDIVNLITWVGASAGDSQCEALMLEMVGGRTIEIRAQAALLLARHDTDAA